MTETTTTAPEALPKSAYLERFKNLNRQGIEIIGDAILVERIKEAEKKTASGIIIGIDVKNQLGTFAQDRPHWVRVLAVGEGYYNDDTGEPSPLNAQPGDIALVSQVSVKWFSTFGDLNGYQADTIGLTRDSEIQIRFKGEEGYRTTFRSLNEGAEAQVEQQPPTAA